MEHYRLVSALLCDSGQDLLTAHKVRLTGGVNGKSE